jgi:hypothetical protein
MDFAEGEIVTVLVGSAVLTSALRVRFRVNSGAAA